MDWETCCSRLPVWPECQQRCWNELLPSDIIIHRQIYITPMVYVSGFSETIYYGLRRRISCRVTLTKHSKLNNNIWNINRAVHQYFIIFYRSSAKRSKEHVARRGKPTYCTVELRDFICRVGSHDVVDWWQHGLLVIWRLTVTGYVNHKRKYLSSECSRDTCHLTHVNALLAYTFFIYQSWYS